jgi:hypothetical protein
VSPRAHAGNQSTPCDHFVTRQEPIAITPEDADLTEAMGIHRGWFTASVSTCGDLDDALRTTEPADGAAYIEVITDPYETPPMYKKLHENVKSFYNIPISRVDP